MNLHTLETVAEQLGVSTDTLKAWIRSGELLAVNVSCDPKSRKPRLRIRQADLDAFLAGRAVASDQPQPRTRRRKLPTVKQYV